MRHVKARHRSMPYLDSSNSLDKSSTGFKACDVNMSLHSMCGTTAATASRLPHLVHLVPLS